MTYADLSMAIVSLVHALELYETPPDEDAFKQQPISISSQMCFVDQLQRVEGRGQRVQSTECATRHAEDTRCKVRHANVDGPSARAETGNGKATIALGR